MPNIKIHCCLLGPIIIIFLARLSFSSAELMSSVVVRRLSIIRNTYVCMFIHTYVCMYVCTFIHTSVCKQGTNHNYWTPEAVIVHGESIYDPHIVCPQIGQYDLHSQFYRSKLTFPMYSHGGSFCPILKMQLKLHLFYEIAWLNWYGAGLLCSV